MKHLEYEVGDLVWVNLEKERFPKWKHMKLMLRKLCPCQTVKKFETNTYHIHRLEYNTEQILYSYKKI